MALVLPGTVENPTPGGVIPSDWGDSVNAAIAYLGSTHPRARVTRSALQVHSSSGSFVTVLFDQETYDVGGCHSTVSNTGRLTAPDDGVYVVGGGFAWEGNTTGRRVMAITKNSTTEVTQKEMYKEPSLGECSDTIVTEVEMAAGDYLELGAFQDSGGSLDILQFADWSPIFYMRWVATA